METNIDEIIEEDFIESMTESRCRCCFSFTQENKMENIFNCVYENFTLSEILNLLVPIFSDCDDGLSQLICENCKTKAVDSFTFRSLCLMSDKLARSENSISDDEYEKDNEFDESNEIIFDTRTESLPEEDEIVSEDAIEIVEDFKEVLLCPYCQESFESSWDFNDHVAQNHEYQDNAKPENEIEQETVEQSLDESELNENEIVEDSFIVREEVDPDASGSSKAKKYKCHLCGKRFESPSKVRRHLTVHRDILPQSVLPKPPRKEYKYECPFCGKRVESPSKLQRHLNVHNEDQKIYNGINQHRPLACPHCDLRFWNRVKVERHMIVHSEEFEKSKIVHSNDHNFICVICLQSVPDYDENIKHMRAHRDDCDENTTMSCKLCSKTYPNLANLVRHARSHIENATHQCIHCGKLMGMGDDLIDHFLRHKGFKPYKCDVESCDKSFLKLHKLMQHKSTHGEAKPKKFPCNLCDKSFAEIEYLKRHQIRHTGRKDHACNLCPARFIFKWGLASHMTTHSNEKPLTCDVCSKKFSKLQTLRTHQKIHVGDKKFSCKTCNMRFITSGHLRRHTRSHTGVKPFQCNYCGKAYGQSNDLTKHLRTHLGPKVYKCNIGECSEAFAKFNELKQHKMDHFREEETISEEIYEGDLNLMKLL